MALNDPTGLPTLIDQDRRRRGEAVAAQQLDPLSGLLLPLSTALARLAARLDVIEATR